MNERRFVAAPVRRLGDRVRGELRNALGGSPSAIAKVRAKNAELSRRVAAGVETREVARALYLKFASLILAHIREHGPETAPPGANGTNLQAPSS